MGGCRRVQGAPGTHTADSPLTRTRAAGTVSCSRRKPCRWLEFRLTQSLLRSVRHLPVPWVPVT